MLSNKMTVSLMSLITIFAFAFVVTPVMAADFGVSLDTSNDFSGASGYQLEHPGAGNKIKITVEFGEAVVLGKEVVQIITLDKSGTLLSLQKFPAAAQTAGDAGREKSFEPVIEDTATTVKIFIAKGIASADPFSANTSAELKGTIGLVGADDGPPTVYSIMRAVDDDHAFAKIAPTTDPTVEVRVVLSEQPKAFTTTHINAKNATVTSVRQLLPQEGTSLADFGAMDNEDKPDAFPRTRMMYDDEIPADVENPRDAADSADLTVYTITDGQPTRFIDVAAADNRELRTAKEKARDMYGGIHRAINEAKELTGDAYKWKEVPDLADDTPTISTDLTPDKVDVEFTTKHASDASPNTLPTYKGEMDNQGTPEALKAPEKPDKTVAAPAVPMLADFGNEALYIQAAARYAAEYTDYQSNANAWAKYNAYMAAIAAEEMKDRDDQLEALPDLSVEDRRSISTGRETTRYPFLVVLTPTYATTADVVVKVEEFEDLTFPVAEKYVPPRLESGYTEGIDKLTIMVGAAKVGAALGAGLEVVIPKDKRIPASGHLVLATNVAGSGIKKPAGSDKDEPKPAERTPAQLKYNVVELGLPNLQTFLANGGTIALVAPAGVYISEIMWGSDSSLSPNNNSQWIEISNSGAASVLTGDKTHKLIFYGLNETPASGAVDTVGTVGTGGFWSITGKGQSGRTGTGEKAADVVAVVPTLELISMQRTMNADGTPADGTLEGSWVQSKGPGVNFDLSQVGTRIGSPGAPIDAAKYPATPTPDTPAPTVPAAAAADIMITEIMVDTGNGRSPQWIELTYSGMAKATLDGWEMVIDNAIDADVLGGGNAITVSLGGVTVDVSKHTGNTGKGHSVLVTAWPATRKSANISDDRVINLATQLNQVSRYQLLSYSGFRITLVPPRTGATIASFGDIAGNLHEDWEIPMSEGAARSSIIRREMVAGAATMGTDAAGWTLADSTSLTIGQPSFYGNDEDAGTPGHDSGGPLPVELSHFRPARDKTTGAAVITWSTQSELNNAGFFIKRSQQRNGQFKVINATMIPGAGTTSEKQFYTFTDTTAQPNVVYYYQIEDVSLDGNRQTLTLGTRLKGHIGAHGKLTTSWGELKSNQ